MRGHRKSLGIKGQGEKNLWVMSPLEPNVVTHWNLYNLWLRNVGMTNDVLDNTFQPQPNGTVRCKQQLGGIIKSYYGDAA